MTRSNPFHLTTFLKKRNHFLSMAYKNSCKLLCLFGLSSWPLKGLHTYDSCKLSRRILTMCLCLCWLYSAYCQRVCLPCPYWFSSLSLLEPPFPYLVAVSSQRIRPTYPWTPSHHFHGFPYLRPCIRASRPFPLSHFCPLTLGQHVRILQFHVAASFNLVGHVI